MLHSSLSRRDFLQVCGGSILAGSVLPSVLAEDKKDLFGGFLLAIQTYTFREYKRETALKEIAKLGIPYVEFYRGHVPVDSTAEQIKAVFRECKDLGITPIAFGVEPFSKNQDENKKRFEFAAALGVKHMSADPDPDSFDLLDKLCEEYKISIAIHPHGPMGGKKLHRWYSAEIIMKAVKDHHPLIGSCLDTGHLIRSEQVGEKLDPVQQIQVMKDRNFGMHLKDHDNKRKTDVVYGKDGGVLDVPGILKALKDVKFKGYIAIEYEANPKDPTKDVAACIDVFKQSLDKLS